MISKYTKDICNITLILLVSVILVSDLFLFKGQPATFDGPTHITNIALMHRGMQEGEFPVYWGDGFARYGMPIPLIAQQFSSYVGAFVTFITHEVVTSFNIVYLVGALFSTILLYIFLRIYVSPFPALAGFLLFHFAPYRIVNIYIRGALPEFFASVWIVCILLSLYLILEKEKKYGYCFLTLSVAFLILTHPFVFVIGSFLFIPYGLFLLNKKKNWKQLIFFTGIAVILGIGITAYYTLPLIKEIRYFYYGGDANHFASGQFLSLWNLFEPGWFYFYKGDIQTRGHVLQVGGIEMLIFLSGLGIVLYQCIKGKKMKGLLPVIVFAGLIIIFFLLPISELVYRNINILGNIQHPWRMLSAFIFIPPIILALLLNKLRHREKCITGIVIIMSICIMRFPQLYAKNVITFPQSSYYSTRDNLHGIILNTVWTGQIVDYPIQKEKPAIIEGKGMILEKEVKNSYRKYLVDAETNIKMVDYTFYFPGWKVLVDGVEQTIQFQDPAYRGIITYEVPKGRHSILVQFMDTKVRLTGKIISLVSLLLLGIIGMICSGFYKKFLHRNRY